MSDTTSEGLRRSEAIPTLGYSTSSRHIQATLTREATPHLEGWPPYDSRGTYQSFIAYRDGAHPGTLLGDAISAYLQADTYSFASHAKADLAVTKNGHLTLLFTVVCSFIPSYITR